MTYLKFSDASGPEKDQQSKLSGIDSGWHFWHNMVSLPSTGHSGKNNAMIVLGEAWGFREDTHITPGKRSAHQSQNLRSRAENTATEMGCS